MSYSTFDYLHAAAYGTTEEVRSILERAITEKAFVILGTHSSNPDEFSPEKTEAILQMVFDMGTKPYL